ncbi:MAG: glutathione S-transferase [Proteobacteria bacterium]|nr:glutathione S-transferase [Pseudomonadota bacterium]
MRRPEYFLYGSQFSLYSGKARSYLRKKGVRFEARSTYHPGYARAVAAIGHVYQPILETAAGEFVQDTTEIIDFVESRRPRPPVYPKGACQRLAALLLELYGDEGLLRPAMHYRWNFPEANDAFLAAEVARSTGPAALPLPEEDDPSAAGRVRWKLISSLMRERRLPAFGVTPASVPAIEQGYAELLDRLEAHFERYPYFLGGCPSIGDFGMIAPLYAHLGRDPEPLRLMKDRAPSVHRWVERMNAGDSDMPEFPSQPPDFLPGDEVPETLIPILRLAARDHLPQLLGIFARVEAWLAAHPEVGPGDQVPGSGTGMLVTGGPFGSHEIELGGTRIEIAVRHYSIWMAQRPLDHHASLDPADRDRADRLLQATGLHPLFDLNPSFRLERRDHREFFASPSA